MITAVRVGSWAIASRPQKSSTGKYVASRTGCVYSGVSYCSGRSESWVTHWITLCPDTGSNPTMIDLIDWGE